MSEKKKLNETGAAEVIWDLSDLYPAADAPELKRDQKRLRELASRFQESYRGKVKGLSPSGLAQALTDYEEIIQVSGKIGSFAHLIWSTNTESPAYGKLLQQASELGSEISQQLVFFDVEWLAVPDDQADALIQSKELKKWRHYLITSRRYKQHTLTEEAEKVMSAKSVTGRMAWNRFFDETLGAARFELDGEKLTEQETLSKLHSHDREVRKRAHESLTTTFRDLSRTLTFVFNTILADKQINDQLRNYENWLSGRNLANQIEDDTVNTLVQSVQSRYPAVQRYYRLKKKLLGVETLYDYDRYAPITQTSQKISWSEAREIVLDAFHGFHPEMARIAKKFFDEKWIDAAIQPGKRGGAYSASTVTTVHPYVFMNFDGQLRDVQTLAHELGHGVHQYLAREQGELQSSTPLTTAETASVFGEMLVFNRLMKRLEDPAEKLVLLISKIDDTIATVFRQISMNRFEDKIHTSRREEGELTTSDFSEHWYQTQTDLYGDSIELTEGYKLWWCYIPHFLHTPGYVYAYAFGELLVLALYDLYSNSEIAGFEEKYLDLLRAGGSDWPETLIGKLGLDVKDPEFWNNGLNLFEEMVREAEALADRI
ncbi:MAG TPA: M3 family oligoendopeptidase [Balneolaceae bacterium]|nr:M3 family oligoendopeptidase [Balneolaceae bacterium]